MNLAWQNFWKHPRTSVNGFLSFLVTASVLLAAEPSLALGVPPKLLALIASGGAIAKLILAVTAKDTGREEAKLPSSENTAMVDAHEIPDDPADKAVTKPSPTEIPKENA